MESNTANATIKMGEDHPNQIIQQAKTASEFPSKLFNICGKNNSPICE